jgi:hypothetical protein
MELINDQNQNPATAFQQGSGARAYTSRDFQSLRGRRSILLYNILQQFC